MAKEGEKMGGGENLVVAGNISAAAHLFPVRDAPFRKTRSVEFTTLREHLVADSNEILDIHFKFYRKFWSSTPKFHSIF